jgi:hypothetical protein
MGKNVYCNILLGKYWLDSIKYSLEYKIQKIIGEEREVANKKKHSIQSCLTHINLSIFCMVPGIHWEGEKEKEIEGRDVEKT